MKHDIDFLQQHYTTVKAIFPKTLSIQTLIEQNLTRILHEQKAEAFHEYSYKAETALGLVAGDLAVVHAKDGLAIVQITQVDATPQIDPNANFNYKWVLDKVDLTAFKRRSAEEKQLTALLDELYYLEKQQELNDRLTKAGLL